MNRKKVVFLLTVVLIIAALTMPLYALYYPDQFYSNRASSYTYNAPYTDSYNCLGYATGSMIWEWPWNPITNKPTPANVAKWGQLERFTHDTRNCYPAVNSGTDQ